MAAAGEAGVGQGVFARRSAALPFAFALVWLLCLTVPAGAPANWSQPSGGSLDVGTHGGCCSSIASVGGVPYVTWSESDGSNRQILVARLDGNSWVAVGGSLNHDTAKSAAGTPTIADVGGVPYVAWSERDAGGIGQLYVKRLNGSAWVAVGSAPLNISSLQFAEDVSLASVAGVAYVAWGESDGTHRQLYVKRFDGSSWVAAGSASLNISSLHDVSRPSLASVAGVAYVAWPESDASHTQLYVKRFDGSSWLAVGSGSLNVSSMQDASSASLASIGGVPYVAWDESDGVARQVRVKRFGGSGWVLVGGSLNFDPARDANGPDTVSVGGIPYVGWSEPDGIATQLRIRRFDGSSWRLVGGPLNTDPSKNAIFFDPVIADIGGVPYATWEEFATGVPTHVRVKRLEPDILSESATPTATGATLTAQVNDYGVPLPIGFEYIPGGLFGPQTPLQSSGGNGVSTLTQTIGGLSPATTYSYRAFGTDSFRETSQGTTQRFTTLTIGVGTIANFRITPSTIVAAGSGPAVRAARKKRGKPGAIVSYTDSKPATTTFTVQRLATGRRQGRKCVKPGKRNTKRKRCTRYLVAGSFTHVDLAGPNRFRFTGRIRGRKLKPGDYRLRAIPRNTAGAGAPTFRRFRVRR